MQSSHGASSSPGSLKFVYTDWVLLASMLQEKMFCLRSPAGKVGCLKVSVLPGGNVTITRHERTSNHLGERSSQPCQNDKTICPLAGWFEACKPFSSLSLLKFSTVLLL